MSTSSGSDHRRGDAQCVEEEPDEVERLGGRRGRAATALAVRLLGVGWRRCTPRARRPRGSGDDRPPGSPASASGAPGFGSSPTRGRGRARVPAPPPSGPGPQRRRSGGRRWSCGARTRRGGARWHESTCARDTARRRRHPAGCRRTISSLRPSPICVRWVASADGGRLWYRSVAMTATGASAPVRNRITMDVLRPTRAGQALAQVAAAVGRDALQHFDGRASRNHSCGPPSRGAVRTGRRELIGSPSIRSLSPPLRLVLVVDVVETSSRGAGSRAVDAWSVRRASNLPSTTRADGVLGAALRQTPSSNILRTRRHLPAHAGQRS